MDQFAMTFPMTLAEVNELSAEDFVARFGDVAEDSPWVARRAEGARPYRDRGRMIEAFAVSVQVASAREQFALVSAHPDLAGRARLAGDSEKEQAGAGLNNLSPTELDQFTRLNTAYQSRFGFPFILAIKGATRDQILAAFEARLHNDIDEEYATALAEVATIIRLRIEERVVERADA